MTNATKNHVDDLRHLCATYEPRNQIG